MKDNFLSLNWWMKVLSALAGVGIAMILIGRVTHVKVLAVTGMWLGVPLLTLAGLLLFVGVPYLMWGGKRKSGKNE